MTAKKKIWLLASGTITLLLLAAGISWAVWFKTDPQVEVVRVLQQRAFGTESRELEPEARRALFEEMRAASEKLTDEQRQALRAEVRDSFQARRQQQISEFFGLSGDERIAYLDQQIDQMEERREEWRQRAEQRERGSDDVGRRGGPPPGGAGERGGWGRRDRGNMTAEQRNDRRRGLLDRTSAEDRAQFAAYREAINERREERGLEPIRRFGRR